MNACFDSEDRWWISFLQYVIILMSRRTHHSACFSWLVLINFFIACILWKLDISLCKNCFKAQTMIAQDMITEVNLTYYLAHCYPYTFTDLKDDLESLLNDADKQKHIQQEVLCETRAGNSCFLVTVTNFGMSCENHSASRNHPVHLSVRQLGVVCTLACSLLCWRLS